jgi:hypothetical protein
MYPFFCSTILHAMYVSTTVQKELSRSSTGSCGPQTRPPVRLTISAAHGFLDRYCVSFCRHETKEPYGVHRNAEIGIPLYPGCIELLRSGKVRNNKPLRLGNASYYRIAIRDRPNRDVIAIHYMIRYTIRLLDIFPKT